ncbi:hypothetical protein M406DRAFT_232898, partial [Cryphonectria parasitica EP155]
LSSILLIASLASFGPQAHRILSYKTCVRIAPFYLLLNLVSATEQFALGLHIIVVSDPGTQWIIKSPPDVGDYLNTLQFAAVWLEGKTSFALFLWYPPRQLGTKVTVVTLYLLFLCISIIPVIFEATLPAQGLNGPENDRRWFAAMFIGIHTLFLAPVITVLSRTGALSPHGLALQAMVFLVAALYWPFRFHMPLHGIPWGYWYQTIGWAAVDNALFVLVQAVLWYVASR